MFQDIGTLRQTLRDTTTQESRTFGIEFDKGTKIRPITVIKVAIGMELFFHVMEIILKTTMNIASFVKLFVSPLSRFAPYSLCFVLAVSSYGETKKRFSYNKNMGFIIVEASINGSRIDMIVDSGNNLTDGRQTI